MLINSNGIFSSKVPGIFMNFYHLKELSGLDIGETDWVSKYVEECLNLDDIEAGNTDKNEEMERAIESCCNGRFTKVIRNTF